MILFVDRCAFNLQEESVFIGFQQVDGFLGHDRQRRHIRRTCRVVLTGHRRLVEITVIAGLRPLPAYRHIAGGKQPQQRLLLIGDVNGVQGIEVFHPLIT